MLSTLQALQTTDAAAIAGLLGGLVLGFAARWGRFCSLGAIEDALLASDMARLKSWGIAISVAIAGTFALDQLSLIDLTTSGYLVSKTSFIATAVGAVLFGYGMALVGTCGYGTLARLGGGDLKSLVTFLVLGISAYATMRGMTAYLRTALFPAADSQFELTNFAAMLSAITTGVLSTHHFAFLIAFALLLVCSRHNKTILPGRLLISGFIVGCCIVWGWYTTAQLARDEFTP